MHTLTLRRAAAAALVPLAVSSLAACGTHNTASVASDPHASTPATSPTKGSSAPARPRTIDSARFLATVKAAARKITTAKVAMLMDVSGQRVPIAGVIDMTGSSPAMRMTMDVTGMGAPTEMRLIGRTIYVSAPGSTGTFYKVDLSDPNGPLGSMGSTLGQLDPQGMLAQMSPRLFKKVVDLGTQTVHRQQIRHYRALMDLSAAPHLSGLPSSATASLPKTATYDVWLDGQGRFVRFVMLMKKYLRMSATYSDYGAPAHITAPPASEVVTMPISAFSS